MMRYILDHNYQLLISHPLSINNVYDGSELAIVRAIVDKYHSADFHKSCEHLESTLITKISDEAGPYHISKQTYHCIYE